MLIAGVDEAGRGPLAGPVLAAAVILSKNSKECSGNFFIDEEVLRNEGETDFEKYAVKSGSKLFTDLYLD